MTNRGAVGGVVVLLALSATSLPALTSGTDVLVAAAGRGAGQADSMWITDLNVLNVGGDTASVEILLLRRNRANPSPTGAAFSLEPGATLVLEDVIHEVFGLDSFEGTIGAFGSGFTGVDSGCNGHFPELDLEGGKVE